MSEIFYNKQDSDNVSSLLNTLAGIGILSLGAGLTWGSVKALFKRMRERGRPVVMEPSKGFHNAYDANRIVVDNNYFPPEEKTAEYLVNEYRDLIKEADWSFNPLEWDWIKAIINGYNKVDETVTKAREVVNKAGDPNTYTEAGQGLSNEIYRILTGASKQDVNDSENNLQRLLPTDSLMTGIKARLATRPALRSMWFFPGAVGAAAAGWTGGNALVNWIDSLLGESKQRKEYSEQARKIYNESAKFLQDVSSGKIKPKMKKESSVKEAETALTGDGSTGFWQLSTIPGLLLAGWLAKQLKGVHKGVDDAKAELADRTHMLWAALAAQKERDYDYNGLYVDTDDISGDTSLDRKLNKKTVSMRDAMLPDNNYSQLNFENSKMNKIRNKSYR